MNDYLKRAGRLYRLFINLTALLVGFGFVLPAGSFRDLVYLWSFVALPFALVEVWRHGLVRGLATPVAVLLVLPFFGPDQLAPLCLDVLLLSLGLAPLLLLVRAITRRLKHRWADRQRQRAAKADLVSVAVRGRATDVSAVEVLEKLGFAEASDQ